MIDALLAAPPTFFATLVVVAILLAAVTYAIFANDTEVDDGALLDFLDQTGYSVQRLSDGVCAVTDGAKRIVGRPANDVRAAVLSAMDSVVTGEVNRG